MFKGADGHGNYHDPHRRQSGGGHPGTDGAGGRPGCRNLHSSPVYPPGPAGAGQLRPLRHQNGRRGGGGLRLRNAGDAGDARDNKGPGAGTPPGRGHGADAGGPSPRLYRLQGLPQVRIAGHDAISGRGPRAAAHGTPGNQQYQHRQSADCPGNGALHPVRPLRPGLRGDAQGRSAGLQQAAWGDLHRHPGGHAPGRGGLPFLRGLCGGLPHGSLAGRGGHLPGGPAPGAGAGALPGGMSGPHRYPRLHPGCGGGKTRRRRGNHPGEGALPIGAGIHLQPPL